MSKIRLHGSSSGYTEIAPVAASGNNTLTLPNDGTIISKDSNGAVGVTSIAVGTGVTIGDGRVTCTTLHGSAANCTQIPAANIVGVCTSGLTKSGGGFGKIIQVSQTAYDSANNITDASSYQDTGLQATITPTSSSNKILVVVHQTYRLAAASGSAQNGGSIRVIRDSTTISNVQAYLLYNNLSGVSNTLYNYDVYNVQILDSPSTTSEITYKTKAIVYGSGNSIYLQYAGRSYLTLMEVVA